MWFIRKLFYSVVVLWGVASLVFTLFSVIPGDPALVVLGPRAGQAEINQFHHQAGTDRSWVKQYLHYMNDLSPISVHHTKTRDHLLYLNTDVYTSFVSLFSFSQYKVILKAPYLRTSYISKTPVSSIIADCWPETAVLAFTSLVLATFAGIAIATGSAAAINLGYSTNIGSGTFNYQVNATIFGTVSGQFVGTTA